ncbi:MAG: M23 family metallopeptidase [Novosphingobium sp.]
MAQDAGSNDRGRTWLKVKTIAVTATVTSLVWIGVGYYELLNQSPMITATVVSDPVAGSATLPVATSAGLASGAGLAAAFDRPIGSVSSASSIPPSTAAIGPLVIPVQAVRLSQLTDTFSQARAEGMRQHDAIDIPAPLGTPVLAAAAGRIEKQFLSKDGGNTIYIRSPDRRTIYYYAHLDRYAPGLAEGQAVKAGQPIGTVGFTGNVNPAVPHLHFAINVVDPADGWWKSEPVNPYPLLMAK